MIEVFRYEHFERLDLRPEDVRRLALDRMTVDKMRALEVYGTGGALIHDGLVLGVFGYIEMWPGVFEVWAFPSIHVKKYSMVYLRTVKQYINVIIKTFDPHRIQSDAVADDLHDRWMEFLGFKCEGTKEQYFVDKTDARQWAIVLGDV